VHEKLFKKKSTSGKRARRTAKAIKGKKESIEQPEDSHDDAPQEEDTELSAPLAIRLRPRPKRRKIQVDEDDEEER